MSLQSHAESAATRRASSNEPPSADDAPTRLDGVLRHCEHLWLRADRAIQHFLPAALNPLTQLGALANGALGVAVVSGIVLLLWYSPSVTQAHASLEHLRTGSWLGQWMRSVHRYSSDACLFLILLHAGRLVAQRRFTGPRWLAWVSGLGLLSLVSLIGWTGYWLVWDMRAKHAALGVARMLDRLPLFTEPFSRSFLTDQSVPSLLFFLVFFAHMLAPLAVGIGIWIHLMRVNRAQFLPSRRTTAWLVGSVAALSIVLPATSADPAHMTIKSAGFAMDWWYLWPIVFTDRLGGGALWFLFLGVGLAASTVPWTLARRSNRIEVAAKVDLPRCMGCTLCSQDCPFNAITMIPREDGRKFDVQSAVNPDLCVQCGICVGSCDSQAINLPVLNSREVEREIQQWVTERRQQGRPAFVCFYCGESAGAAIAGGGARASSEWDDFRLQRVPCVGWVSAVLLERTLQKGADGILVTGCGEGDPIGREGIKWFQHRLDGRREPRFDPTKADAQRIHFVQLNRTQPGALLKAAQALRESRQAAARPVRQPNGLRSGVAAVVIAVVLMAVVAVVSAMPYRTPHSPDPELIVSFNHGGARLADRTLTVEERQKLPPHMRAQFNLSRERAPVRMKIAIDDREVSDQVYKPKGLSKDGPSTALVQTGVSPGRHRIRVRLADTANVELWTQSWDEVVEFSPNQNRVLLFDSKKGFTLH